MIYEVITTYDRTFRVRIPEKIGRYQVVQTIGKGGFAVVVLALDPKTNDRVAIKIVNREEINRQNLFSYLENELRLHSRLSHPNVVKILDIFYEEDIIMIVMEYLVNGDLQTLINRGIHFNFEEQLKISFLLLDGLNYLHQRGIAHRDIKPENILFDANFNPKLIDFGLSRESKELLNTFCGTTLFMAPEILMSNSYDGKKADIWSFGVTINILATGRFPWITKSDAHFIHELKKGHLDMYIQPTGALGMLIKNCLIIDPIDRPTTEELISLLRFSLKSTAVFTKINVPRSPSAETLYPSLTFSKDSSVLSRSRKLTDKSLPKMFIPVKRHFN